MCLPPLRRGKFLSVTVLQTISSRRCAPTEPVVVTAGSFQAGVVGNVIPETATILGTIRTMTAESRAKVKAAFCQIVTGVAAAMDVSVDIDIMENYPAHNPRFVVDPKALPGAMTHYVQLVLDYLES